MHKPLLQPITLGSGRIAAPGDTSFPAHPSERQVMSIKLNRTKDNPWKLRTPPGTSEYTMHVDEKDGKQILVCTVGSTVLHYAARCIDDLHPMLKAAADWVELGGADEQKPAKDGSVEAWGRSQTTRLVAGTV